MNVLFICNSAPDYHLFLNPLMSEFVADGHTVTVAIDSEYSLSLNQLPDTLEHIFVFSRYMSGEHTNPSVLERYKRFNLNAALLSDYERSEIFKFGKRREKDYYDQLKSGLLSFYEAVFSQAKIDLVVHENVSSALSHFAYFVCLEQGVAYCGVSASRLPGRWMFSEDPLQENDIIDRRCAQILQGDLVVPGHVVEWTQEYLKRIDHIEPDYMSYNKLDELRVWATYANRRKMRKLATALRHSWPEDHTYDFQTANPVNLLLQQLRRSAMRRLRLPMVKTRYESPSWHLKFLLYPLQFHPESSTSVLAGAYLDEYEVIRNIAFNLPEGFALLVKDHKSSFARMPLNFYIKLARLPNVHLVGPYEDTKSLIRLSSGVITLTSTVGYEALLLSRRVFLFGQVFYQGHLDVVRIADPTKVFDLLCEWIDEPVRASREYNSAFVEAYFLSTEPGELDIGGPQSAELARKVYPRIVARYVNAKD